MIARDERPLFSSRYGIMAPERVAARVGREVIPAEDFWRCRHSMCFQNDAIPELLRCACPGTNRNVCTERATQEDRLCNACREWCVAVDDEHRYHSLISLYGSAR